MLCIPLFFDQVLLALEFWYELWGVGQFEIQARFPCTCFVIILIPNSIFLFYRWNTLGHAGLTYFMQEFSKLVSRGTES